VEHSIFEAMRSDPANWKLGLVYSCREDPRVVVLKRRGLGWCWNFGNPRVLPAIGVTVIVFFAPVIAAWQLGVRSRPLLASALALGLVAVMLGAHRAARDPGV